MRISQVPMIRHARSSFDLSHDIKTSMNVGTLYPLDVIEVLPGDTFKGDIRAVSRVSSAFLKPVMDNLFMDIHAFFVPTRLVYNETEKVFGNPNPTAYTNDDFSVMPTNLGEFVVYPGSVGDYLGIPVGTRFAPGTLNLCPFRAFARVYNDWFRNQNTINETYIQLGEGSVSEIGNNNEWSPTNYCGLLPKVMKRKDYFTSCLPQPQKGDPVELLNNGVPVRYSLPEDPYNLQTAWSFDVNGRLESYPRTRVQLDNSSALNPILGSNEFGVQGGNQLYATTPAFADINLNVNDLRYSFALQKMLERDARSGSRMYSEAILANFGVSTPDSRLMMSEYLGGGRFPLNIQQVAQTSQGNSTSPLANVGGYSLTEGFTKYNKGFTEYGYIVICGCIKQMHTYQQGIPRHFMRKERLDFYDTAFQSIGEQPVYTWQLFNHSLGQDFDYIKPIITLRDGEIFGFQEAWAEYRQLPNMITGQMRSSTQVNGRPTISLDLWHFADKFEDAPTLSSDFTNETPNYVDRALAVPSTSQDQFIVDIWHGLNAIRVLPTFSVPSLIDHH